MFCGTIRKTTTRGRKIYLSRGTSSLPVAVTLVPFVDHHRRSCLSPRCSNLDPAMIPVTLDNTIGAAFLGVVVSCMWVIYQRWSKPQYITTPQSAFSELPSFKHIYTTTTFLKTGFSKKSQWGRCKLPWKKIIDFITRLGSSCRRALSLDSQSWWGAITFVSLQDSGDFAYGIHNPCHVLLPYRELWKPGRPWHYRLVRALKQAIPYISCPFIFIWTGASR